MATKSERFPKRFYKAEDLKGRPLVLEIEEEKVEEINDPKTGKTVSKSVLSFVNTKQKLVLNATNFDLICEITGLSDSSEWPGQKIELYADRTTMAGSRVDCVRIRKPRSSQPALAPVAPSPSAAPPTDKASSESEMDDAIPF